MLKSAVWQPEFDPSDVPFQSFRTMDKQVRQSIRIDSEIKTKSLHEKKDGDQCVEFHYVSIMAEIERMLANPAYSGKTYTHREYHGVKMK